MEVVVFRLKTLDLGGFGYSEHVISGVSVSRPIMQL